jgi:hypothetical protein
MTMNRRYQLSTAFRTPSKSAYRATLSTGLSTNADLSTEKTESLEG